MEYYNSFHSISEFLRQGKGRLLVDSQRLVKARGDAAGLQNDKSTKKSRLLQLIQLAEQYAVTVEERASHELQGLLEQSHYRGYILALDRCEFGALEAKASSVTEVIARRSPLVLLLDGVLDVGNLGAIVRSSDLFGAAAVFVGHRSAGRTHRQGDNQIGRASAGASAWVPIIEGNLAQIAQQLSAAGYWLYAADMSGAAAAQTEFQQPCALILGAEERGISLQLRQLSDFFVRIPTQGHIDSLNVSAAGAVLMYEIKRQWGQGVRDGE